MDELVLDVPGQIAQVKETKPAVTEEEAQTPRVVARVRRLRLVFFGDGVFRRTRLIGNNFAQAAQAEEAKCWPTIGLSQGDCVSRLEDRGFTLRGPLVS